MNACRVALHARGQVLNVPVVSIRVADLVVEGVHVRRSRRLLDELGDFWIVPWNESERDHLIVLARTSIMMKAESNFITEVCGYDHSG